MTNISQYHFRVSLLAGLFWLAASTVAAQPMRFEHVTVEDGLSSNYIDALLEDSRGYLWMGTEQGLNRFDGYGVKVYRAFPSDTTSLNHDWVKALHEGRDGTLWVGTPGGLHQFDPATGVFTRYRHRAGDPASLSHDWVRVIHEASDGTLWVGTEGGGLNRFDPQSGAFTAFRHRAGEPASLSHDVVRALHEARDGTLWVGTDGGGLNHFEPATSTFTAYRHSAGDRNSLSDDRIWALYEDANGMLWVGTEGGGLNRFDPQTGVFTIYRHREDNAASLSSDFVSVLYATSDGTLWVGTFGGGLARFDPATNAFTAYRHRAEDPTSLSGDFVSVLYATSDGTLWVGTRGGLNRFDPARSSTPFSLHDRWEDEEARRSGQGIPEILEARDGTLWVGTGAGINRFDPATGTFRQYRDRAGNATGLVSGTVIAMHEARDGALWIGKVYGPLHRFDPATENLTTYQPRQGDPTRLNDGMVNEIAETKDGMLWLGTSEGGLSRYDPQRDAFTTYRHVEGDPTSLGHDKIRALHEAHDGTLWVGTYGGGLSRYDPQTDTFTAYRHVEGDPTSLSHNIIHALHESQDGTLWVGAANGLNRLQGDPADPRSISFLRYTPETSNFDGNSILRILEDDRGMLWLNLISGTVVRFDPEIEYFRYFGSREGVQAGSFHRSAVRTRRGTMYFGGTDGMVAFDPVQIQEDAQRPRLYLTDLRLFNQVITPGPDALLKAPLSETEEVVLRYDENDVSIGFVGIHHSNPKGTRYNYRLVNYDRGWRGVTGERRATYTALPPRAYRFEVKAANGDGYWTQEPVALRIVIQPPWWRTTWAYILYGLLLIGGVLAADRIQRRRLIRKERDRAERERQTRELEQARQLQLAMLPQAVPRLPQVQLAACMATAAEVGGDFYDFEYHPPNGRDDPGTLNLIIGDATGHGTEAGMVVTAAKGILSALPFDEDLGDVLQRSSFAMRRMRFRKLFMALAIARLRGLALELAGAGMPPALVYRAATQQVEQVPLKGLPLGSPAQFPYQTRCLTLRAGDTVVLMSDGFPELFNQADEMLGYEGAVSAFEEAAALSPEEIIAHLQERGRRWSNGRAQDDDVTFVVMKVKEKAEDSRQ